MGYSSVQIFGKMAAVKAFRNTDCINWALLQGKQLLFKYEGNDQNLGGTQLEELLKMISESSGSDAVYTLRWYERDDIPETKPGKPVRAVPKFKIYESTPWDGSFNFKLFNNEGGEYSSKERNYQELTAMKAEFDEMKTLLKELIKTRNQEDEELDREKNSGIAGIFSSLIEMPEVKSAIAGKVVELFHGVTNKIGSYLDPNVRNVPAKIAGSDVAPEPIQMPPDQVQKLNSALTILAQVDPQLPDNLLKLAGIAQKDPSQYKMLIGMLNKM
jgi:hypothetical protein